MEDFEDIDLSTVQEKEREKELTWDKVFSTPLYISPYMLHTCPGLKEQVMTPSNDTQV